MFGITLLYFGCYDVQCRAAPWDESKIGKKQCLVTDCYAFEKLYITGLANSELDMSNIFLLGRPCIKISHLYFLSWEDLRM